MIADGTRNKLQNIIRGARIEGAEDCCTTIRNFLIESFGASTVIKGEFESRAIVKEKQVQQLTLYAQTANLWLSDLPVENKYLTRGGEAEVYLSANGLNIIKLNSGIYYATWTEYFNSLVIHNLLFPNTAYTIAGFTTNREGEFSVVLEQPFIEGEQAELNDIRELLTFNGFTNIKRQDYYNDALGLLLEDMHDENVIKRENVLFFIDTVFYIMK